MTAGPKARQNARMSASFDGRANAGRTPARFAAVTRRRSCAAPETVTPHAAACAAVGKRNAIPSAAIMQRLSRTGAKLAAMKRSTALSEPESWVTSVMNRR